MTPTEKLNRLTPLLVGLCSNPIICLDDAVYNIKEIERKGWDGPIVVEWHNLINDIRNYLKNEDLLEVVEAELERKLNTFEPEKYDITTTENNKNNIIKQWR